MKELTLTESPKNPQIEFAKRNIIHGLSTFNAWSALQRLQLLIDDINELKEILSPTLEERIYPSFFEISSYYQVGIVTCLEWHAKSRLFDLLNYNPKLVRQEDIKQLLNNPNILGMTYEGLTIPHLVASAGNIATVEKYVSVISRVLSQFKPKVNLGEILGRKTSSQESYESLLRSLFNDRNQLVHEITLSDIGHRNIRYYKSFDEVLSIALIVDNIIKEIEVQLSASAPYDFPNLLDSSHVAVTKTEVLKRRITEAEAVIREAISSGVLTDIFSLDQWDTIIENHHHYLEKEEQFIDSMSFPGYQYYDPKHNILERLLECRLEYLVKLRDEVLPAV